MESGHPDDRPQVPPEDEWPQLRRRVPPVDRCLLDEQGRVIVRRAVLLKTEAGEPWSVRQVDTALPPGVHWRQQ